MEKELLKHGETVTFVVGEKNLKYRVLYNFLAGINCETNDLIFKLLGIEDKNAFCTEFYGYKNNPGDFPSCKSGDYAALTRVYNALQELCDEYNGVTKEITYEIY